MNSELFSTEILTSKLIDNGITTWNDLTEYIANLPYGRNINREDFSLVLKEQKGTCSSKHALLSQVAIENNFSNIKLIIGIYKMAKNNTPGIGDFILNSTLPYIPEAHCYLKIDGQRADFTTSTSNIKQIVPDILTETEIAPHQVAAWKVDFHQQFIRNWLISENINSSFSEIWNIREQSIAHLALSK